MFEQYYDYTHTLQEISGEKADVYICIYIHVHTTYMYMYYGNASHFVGCRKEVVAGNFEVIECM